MNRAPHVQRRVPVVAGDAQHHGVEEERRCLACSPRPTPTVADYYLTSHQAKTALHFEKRGAALLELTAYEPDCPRTRKAPRADLQRRRT